MPVDAGQGVAVAIEAALRAAGELDSVLGRQALDLASRLPDAKSGSGLAAMHKELRSVMSAVAGVAVGEIDPVDELKAKRVTRKRAG